MAVSWVRVRTRGSHKGALHPGAYGPHLSVDRFLFSEHPANPMLWAAGRFQHTGPALSQCICGFVAGVRVEGERAFSRGGELGTAGVSPPSTKERSARCRVCVNPFYPGKTNSKASGGRGGEGGSIVQPTRCAH